MKHAFLLAMFAALAGAAFNARAQSETARSIPRLQEHGTTKQLVVDGKPFLVLAGEVHNSSSSSLDYMKPIWSKLAAAHLNTVLVPVSWELVEPEEGKFDFSLVDGLIKDAREHDLKLSLLWFGTWKNLVSSYAPVWVRAHPDRFACAMDKAGNRLPILSTFSEVAREADSKAFAALMRHVKQVEEGQPRKTVLMIQVQNEVGMPGGERDWSAAANAAFAGPVPQALMDRLIKQKALLDPELSQIWSAAGSKTSGTWEEVLGKGKATSEIFMAWNYARYIGKVIDAGKAEYPIPMFVNASVGRQDGKTGTYPSGGPVAYVTDVWRAGAPQLDMLCPDVYYGSFSGWCENYVRAGNPLFIPEMRAGAEGVVHALTAIGEYGAIGCSPFGIDGGVEPDDEYSKIYDLLSRISPVVLESQGKQTMAFAEVNGTTSAQVISLGRYAFHWEAIRKRDTTPEANGAAADPARGYALAIEAGADEYFVIGKNIQCTFSPNPPAAEVAAIDSADEGTFRDGQWVAGRRLNGDETMLSYSLSQLAAANQTGTGVRFPAEAPAICRIKLVRYPASTSKKD